MSKQPEALRLADELEMWTQGEPGAVELRRQHAEIERPNTEAVATDIRIGNDAAVISELKAAREAMIDNDLDKLMAMTDEQVKALARMEGSNPADVAKLTKNVFEIAQLRVKNDKLTAELEQSRVQLAGCGVAAMENTEASKTKRIKRGDYGWSESYGDVCRAVDREIELRAERDALRADAMRYRAIPSMDWYVGPMFGTYNDVVDGELIDHNMSKESLDAAIDAAMKGQS